MSDEKIYGAYMQTGEFVESVAYNHGKMVAFVLTKDAELALRMTKETAYTFTGLGFTLWKFVDAKPSDGRETIIYPPQTCTVCGEINAYAVPNQKDGTYQCTYHGVKL